MNMWEMLTTGATVLVSSGIAASAVSALTLRKTRKIEESVRQESEKSLQEFRSTREAKERMLTELVGPICMHLHRTKRAFARYKDSNAYLEAEILFKGNAHARDLILQRGYILDPRLLGHAIRLLEHYDAWLEEYAKQRQDPYASGAKFVFAGPRGYPFPVKAEQAFMNMCHELRSELYGTELD
jgi:hypothetical protein